MANSDLKKPCPFCGGEALYIQNVKDENGVVIPEIFCNNCKTLTEVENDSPYLNDANTYQYLLNKLLDRWNSRGEK